MEDKQENKQPGEPGFAAGDTSKEEKMREWHHFHHRRAWMFGWLIVLVLFVVLVFGLLTAGFNSHKRGMVVGRFNENMSFKSNRNMTGSGRMGMRGWRSNGLTVKVTAVSGQTITVDDAGTSKQVQIISTTRFPLGSTTKISTGDTITVIGGQDSSGVIQADQIFVNP